MISSFVEDSAEGAGGGVNYVLCYRDSNANTAKATATTPTPFTTNVNSLNIVGGARVPFTAAGTVMPGAGTWDVGLCVAATVDVQGGTKQGFVQVTN
jgi:hypothetical protein